MSYSSIEIGQGLSYINITMHTSTKPLQRIMGEQTPLHLLNHEEEMALARRVAHGHAAQKQLTKKNLNPKRRRASKHQLADADAAREALILHNLRPVLNLAGSSATQP